MTKALNSFSISDVDEMFFGAIISNLIDGQYILKMKKGYCVTKHTAFLYDIIYNLQIQQGSVDFLSVFTELSKHIPAPEAKTLIDGMINKIVGEFKPEKALEMLEEAYMRRNVDNLLTLAKQRIQESPRNSAEILYNLYEQTEQLTESSVVFDIAKEFDKTSQEILTGESAKIIIKTGFPKVDSLIGGFSRQDISIIGARPGHGKTTSCVALSLAMLKANPGLKVSNFQLEMSLDAYKRKVLANASGVSSYRMRVGKIEAGDEVKLAEGVKTLAGYQDRLFIFDKVFDLFTMHKINRTLEVDICLVDFITLMDDADESNLRLSLGRIMKSSKRFAKTHNMNYTFFSQLNRGQEFREDNIPTQSDLAESDYLTQLASEILLLFYKFKYSNLPGDRTKIQFIFDKARYTGVADIAMGFDPDLCRVYDLPSLSSSLKK